MNFIGIIRVLNEGCAMSKGTNQKKALKKPKKAKATV